MEEESQHKSSVLLIDHPSVQPPLTRVRSIQIINGKMIEKLVCSTVPPRYSLQNSCNNWLCFAKYSASHDALCLLDLVSNKVVTLPHPKYAKQTSDRITFYGLGFDHRSKVYKTLHIEAVFKSNILGNLVLSAEFNRLGEDTWNPVWGRHPTGSIFCKPLAVDGALVWADFPQTDVAMSSQRCVSAFDLSEEKFFKVRLPQKFHSVGHLVVLNGKLCAADLSSDSHIHIWVLPNLYGSWDSLCRIKIRTVRGEKDHRRTRVIGSLDGKLLLKSYTAYFTYEAATEKLEFVHLPVGTDPETEVHCYPGEDH